jgi:hypothetical protein
MVVTVVHLGDVIHAGKLATVDPFQLAAPCYSIRVWHQLPPETINTSDVPKEKIHVMPIHTIEESKAPARLFVRGGISSKTDYMEVLAELNKNQKGVALVVDMDKTAWANVKKPEVTFANSLRRRFEMSGLALTAYMSAPFQITVRKYTQLELKEKEAGKGKREPRKK